MWITPDVYLRLFVNTSSITVPHTASTDTPITIYSTVLLEPSSPFVLEVDDSVGFCACVVAGDVALGSVVAGGAWDSVASEPSVPEAVSEAGWVSVSGGVTTSGLVVAVPVRLSVSLQREQLRASLPEPVSAHALQLCPSAAAPASVFWLVHLPHL